VENDFWLSLAANDLDKSRAFFQSIGFVINDAHASPGMVSMFVGNKRVVVNLFPAATLQGFLQNPVADPVKSNEVVMSLGANSREEVDAIAKRVVAAGGKLYGEPGDRDGWMYGCGFIDLDGHRWAVLFMDMSKLPGR
jgi:predicted lactoylglutathione lyase